MSIESYEAVQQLLSKLDTDGFRVKLPAVDVYSPDIIETDDEGCVLVKPMTGEEESLISNAEAIINGRTISTLLRRLVVGCKKPEELYDPDVEFLIAAIKAVTFTSEYDTPYMCKSCGEHVDAIVDSNNLVCQPYTKDDIQKSFELPNGQTVVFRHIPLIKELNLGDDGDAVIKSSIVSVDGIEDRTAIGKWLEKLKLPLYKSLKQNMNVHLGGFETSEISTTCPHCNTENHVEVNITTGFLFDVLLVKN